VKTIGPDKTYIDYFQGGYCPQRGVTNCFGIRVEEGCCVAIAIVGDGQPFTFGKYFLLPLESDTLPSPIRIVVDDHLLTYPSSDLDDVLAGKKSFQEALHSPPESETQQTTATGRVRLAHSS